MIQNRSLVERSGASPTRLWTSVASMGTLKPMMTGLKYSRATRFLCGVVVSGGLSASAQVQEAWVQTFPGPLYDEAVAIMLDTQGNVCVTGNHSTNQLYYYARDIVTLKYSPAGGLLWSNRYDGTVHGDDFAAAMAVDAAGQIWVAGSSQQLGVDEFDDPNYGIVTIKYSTDGTPLWVRRYDVGSSHARAIAVDADGNAYVAGTTHLAYSRSENVTIKYSPNGDELWRTNEPPDLPSDIRVGLSRGTIAMDSVGNLYTAGRALSPEPGALPEIQIVKSSSAGAVLWAVSYRGVRGWEATPTAIKVDGNDNVVVTGTTTDPTQGLLAVDFITAKYDPAGNQLWAARYNGPGQHYDTARALAVDAEGNIYVSGISGSGPYPEEGFTTVKYSPAGNQLWETPSRSGGATAVTLDAAANVYAAGFFEANLHDFAVVKYTQSAMDSQPSAFVNPSFLQSVTGSNVTLTASAAGSGPFSYQWRFFGGLLTNETNAILELPNIQAIQQGDYSVIVSNTSGYTISPEARVLVNVPPIVSSAPQTNKVVAGRSVLFAVQATGDPPLAFQWQFNGTNILGATGSELNLLGVEESDTGTFSVIVSNPYGVAVSGPYLLTVMPRGPVDYWYWRNPLPQGNDLYSSAYGNGLYVVVGRAGALLTSVDGTNWISHNEERFGDLLEVLFADGKFVAVGSPGRIFVSTNGLDWESRGPNFSQPFTSVAYGNGTFVVAEWSSNGFFTSTNALDWTPRTLGMPDVEDISFGAGRFVAVGLVYNSVSHTIVSRIQTSTDGVNWTPTAFLSGSPGLYRATYGNGQFVVAGEDYTATSTDGVQWTAGTFTGFPGELAAGAGVFLCLSGDNGSFRYNRLQSRRVLSSSDGLSWVDRTPPGINILYGAAFVAGGFLVVGNNGNLFNSPNGIDWTQISDGTDNNLRALTHGAGLYVAVGNGGNVFTSGNGLQWTRQRPPTTNNLHGVACGNGLFVATSAKGELALSRNGVAWWQARAGSNDLFGIIYTNDLFAAVGDGGMILTSQDGTNWTSQNSGTIQRLHGLSCGNGAFIATGRGGVILTSTDATNWTSRNSGTTSYLEGAAYGNGLYVAVGQGGAATVSPDGVNWTARGTGVGADLEHITFGAGVFVAVGEDGTVLSSTNGMDWLDHYSGCQNNLRNIQYADGAFMVAGNNDTILQSGPLVPYLATEGLGQNGFEMRVRGVPNRRHRIQASGDLQTWQDLLTFQNSQENTMFVDPDTGANPRRFYRVRLEP